MPTTRRLVLSVPPSPARPGARIVGRRILGLADEIVSDCLEHGHEQLESIAALCFAQQATGLIYGAYTAGLIGLIERMNLSRLIEQEVLRIDGYWEDSETMEELPGMPAWNRCASVRDWIDAARAERRTGPDDRRWVVMEHPAGGIVGERMAWGHEQACERLERARRADPDGWACLGRIAPVVPARRAPQPPGCARYGAGWGGMGPRTRIDARHDAEEVEHVDELAEGLMADAQIVCDYVSEGRCGREVALMSHRQHAWGLLEAIRCLVDDKRRTLMPCLEAAAGVAQAMIEPHGAGPHRQPMLGSRVIRDAQPRYLEARNSN